MPNKLCIFYANIAVSTQSSSLLQAILRLVEQIRFAYHLGVEFAYLSRAGLRVKIRRD